MSTLLLVLHVIVCLFLMLTVLLQQGKSGGMGGAFGGGNAATVFGGSGASTFLRKLTTVRWDIQTDAEGERTSLQVCDWRSQAG